MFIWSWPLVAKRLNSHVSIECSEDDVPDSHWRMDCHCELTQLAISPHHCSEAFSNQKKENFIKSFGIIV